jgi:hypothetical protein
MRPYATIIDLHIMIRENDLCSMLPRQRVELGKHPSAKSVLLLFTPSQTEPLHFHKYALYIDWMASRDPDEYFIQMGNYSSWKEVLDTVDREEGRTVQKF